MRDERLTSVFAEMGEVPSDIRKSTEETLESLECHSQVPSQVPSGVCFARHKRAKLTTAIAASLLLALLVLFATGQHLEGFDSLPGGSSNGSSKAEIQEYGAVRGSLDALEDRIESIPDGYKEKNAASGIDYVSLQHDLEKTLSRYRDRIENAASEDEQSALWEELVNRLDRVCKSYGVDGQVIGLSEPRD